MKEMTCKQLGGACDQVFRSDTFEEMAKLSQEHGKKMARESDTNHLRAMKEMQDLMMDPEKMKEWFAQKRKDFEALPEVD